MKKTQRLDKILVHLGYGTRSEIKKLVRAGSIHVNGKTAGDSGMQVNPLMDEIRVRDETVYFREFIYIMLNKPQGVVSATEDLRDSTVIDLLDERYAAFNAFPVGRLDKDTEGLLLLTNDGKLAHMLLSPRRHVPKTYYAKVLGKVTDREAASFRQGVVLDDGYETMPAELRILSVQGGEQESFVSEIELTIAEGKFHQVKRMFQAVGMQVVFLKRISMGGLLLDDRLSPGEYRELTETEINMLKEWENGKRIEIQDDRP
ncbi:pseudouridine synthase [Ferviditalea candida]|uniref:Pseudouridine synthase n=1 Tax=Ferviditalea candida TaxID=3108399 RepID=A0ABU5ZCH1_9BACL|nr:pseudouridine synthase [Paenibacillaceae bacterium T2]